MLFAVAMLLAAPACTPPARVARVKPVPRAPPPTGFRREEPPPPRRAVAIPLDGIADDSYVTILVRLRDLSPEQRARVDTYLQQRPFAEGCDCVIFPPADDTIIITERRSTLECLLPELF